MRDLSAGMGCVAIQFPPEMLCVSVSEGKLGLFQQSEHSIAFVCKRFLTFVGYNYTNKNLHKDRPIYSLHSVLH